MTEKLLKIANISILFLLFNVLSIPFFMPGYLHPHLLIFYEGLIVFIGFIFIMANKFLKTEIKIETPIDPYLFFIFIWYIISIPISTNPFLSLNASATFFIFLLFFYITYTYSIKYFRYFIFFIILIATLLSLYGIYQYFWGFDLTLKSITFDNSEISLGIKERLLSKRIFSTFIYPNAFAGFLILILPVAIGFYKIEKQYRLILLPSIIILLAALLLTKSIGAFLSLILAILIVAFLISDKALKNFKFFKILFLITIILFLIIIVMINLRGINRMFSHLIGKLESYLKMIEIISKNLFFGYGPGSFETIYNKPTFGDFRYLKFAHNIIFQIFIETGLIGIILFFLVLFYGYRTILENFFFLRTTYKKILIFSLLIGITSSLIHNLIDFDINNFEIAIVFILFTAIIFSQTNIYILHTKKLKLTYLLGINPGKRRDLIFIIILAILFFSAITAGRNPVIFSILIILTTFGFAIWSVSKENIRHTEVDVPVILFLLYLLFSLIITPFKIRGSEYFITFFSAFIIFYLCSQFLQKTLYKVIISNFLIILGIIIGLINALQNLIIIIFKVNIPTFAFFPNGDIYADYLLIPFALVLSKIFLEKKHKYLLLKISSLLLLILLNAFAFSKCGILSMMIIFIAFYFYYKKNCQFVKDTQQMYELKSKLLKIIAIIMIISFFTPLTPSGKKILNTKGDPFYFNRLEIYKTSIKMFKDNFLIGWGIGSFERVFPKYNFPTQFSAKYQMTAQFAHNEFLNAAVELGLIGTIIFLILLFIILKSVPFYEGHKKLWAANSGAYFAFIGILFHSIFDIDWHVPAIIFTMAILISFIIKEKFIIKNVPETLLFIKIYYFPALILSIILLTVSVRPGLSYLLFKNYEKNKNFNSIYNASLTLPLNSEYLFELGKFYEQNNNNENAELIYFKLLEYDKYNFIVPLHIARINMIKKKYDDALKYYKLSLSNNPFRPFTYSEIGDFYFNIFNDINTTKNYYLKAIELEPNYLPARNNLANIYKMEKNYSAALEQYNYMEDIINKLIPVTDYEKQLFFMPEEKLYYNKATLYEELKDYKKSCYYYNKSYEIKQDEIILKKIKKLCQKEK